MMDVGTMLQDQYLYDRGNMVAKFTITSDSHGLYTVRLTDLAQQRNFVWGCFSDLKTAVSRVERFANYHHYK